MYPRHLFASVLLLVTVVASQGFAQQPAKVELNEEQRELNNQAIRALQQVPPDVERAMRLVEAAWLVGEPNRLVGLTAGRAHHMAGRCHKAERAYVEAEEFPGVVGVSDDVLAAKANKYRDELSECFGSIVVDCERASVTRVKIDGVERAQCGSSHRVDPVLAECHATDLDDRLRNEHGWTGTTNISDNDTTGTCP